MGKRGDGNMICYKNNYGQTVYLDRWPYKMLTDTDLFDYEWSYETQNELNPKISRFYRNMVQRKVGIVIGVKKDEDYATELIEAFEKDVIGVTPGKLYVNDSYVSCYFIKGEKTKWKSGQPFPMVTFTLICEKGSWITESSTTFRPGTTPPDTNSVSGTFLNILDAINSTMYLTSWTRNLLTRMTLANLKTANPSGTWTDTNSTTSTYVISSLTVTVTHISGNVLSININGTPSSDVFFKITPSVNFAVGTYMVSGCPSGGSSTTYNILFGKGSGNNYDIGSGTLLNSTSASDTWNFYIYVKSGTSVTNKLFLPQIESGNVKHNFVPPSGYPVYACQKNLFNMLLPIVKLSGGTWTDYSGYSTCLVNGLTFTVNHTNGNVYSISVTGTATSDTYFNIATGTNGLTLPQGSYIANGCPSGGSTTGAGYFLAIGSGNDVGSGVTFTNTTSMQRSCYIVVKATKQMTGQVFQPMIRLASVTDATYEAYNGNTYNLTNDTASPVPATCFSGVTNVFSGYGGMLNLTYPREIPVYLDYPYDYSFDYMALDQSQNITNGSYAAAHFEMLVYGACTNPSVIIGGHEYEVDCVLATGEYLVINTLNKKVYKVNLDGTKESQLNNRNRDSYIFEKLPSGSNTVQWNGLFGFDVNMLMERSEPIWI